MTALFPLDAALAGLFASAFIAATLFPASSEALLAALLLQDAHNPWLLWGVATLGNGLGSVVNWMLGAWLIRFADRRWFPVSPQALARAQERFARYGVWSLLFAWVPLIGDPLTVAAGALRVRLWLFCVLVFFGKGARYAIIAGLFHPDVSSGLFGAFWY
ncbi:putative inner membrane protein YqaA [Magnetofaba australis IT-1]|uniref:Putative inner membrane protein YqaA n=2 Tax=Magnetofaba TaxID=1472292 RepID=A0A1Y2K3C5_9PROT|nr:putative inner membrane protein YqaA [Magnetofaba australis IT-1]